MTDLQTKLLKAYRMNIGRSVESELRDNCNPIDARDAARLAGITRQAANGLLVSLRNAGYLEDSTDGNGDPLYMFTDDGVRAWYSLR